jgi:hypothetical protein
MRARTIPLILAAFALGAVATSSASAAGSYEQVNAIKVAPGEPSAAAWATAVNETGAGGVAAGTVYVLGRQNKEPVQNLRWYAPGATTPSGEVQLVLAAEPEYLAIDQGTGQIVTLSNNASAPVVSVYEPHGSGPIEQFGEIDKENSDQISTTPGMMHDAAAITVDDECNIYVGDNGRAEAHEPGGQKARVMVFRPTVAGMCAGHSYAGEASDFSDFPAAESVSSLGLDSHGDLYVGTESAIREFPLSTPGIAKCAFAVPAGGIIGMTVDPASEEVFYDSYKDGNGHQLGCHEGEYHEVGSFKINPRPSGSSYVLGLSFDLTRVYHAGRPPGIIYAAGVSEALLYDFARPETHDPTVEDESAASVSATSARLSASVNPEGVDTRYVFQYLTEAAYESNEPANRFAGALEAPIPGGVSIGSRAESVAVHTVLSGLQPRTSYRYRVLAVTSEGEVSGSPEEFRTYGEGISPLPDGRSYELVSPVNKNGGEVYPPAPSVSSCSLCKPGIAIDLAPMQSSPDGEALAYYGEPFSAEVGAARQNEYLARRTASGWETTTLSPAFQSSGEHQGYIGFSNDLSRGVLYQSGPALSALAPSEYGDLYEAETVTPSLLEPLLSDGQTFNRPPNKLAGGANLVLTYAGGSSSLSRVFFEANDALTEAESPEEPAAIDGGALKNNLYEYTSGRLRLVNVAPSNGESEPGAEFGGGKNIQLGGEATEGPDLSRAISEAGTRVYWTAANGGAFVRIHGERTVALPNSDACKSSVPAASRVCFLTASADGSKALLSNGMLYSLNGEETAFEPMANLTGGAGGFEGIVGQSDDLSQVYFVDTATLTGANDEGLVPNEHGVNEPNLYSWHESSPSFIATLTAQDGTYGDWAAAPIKRLGESSPDGNWLGFRSVAPLAGVHNIGPCKAVGVGPCQEVFLYDRATAKLVCASCAPSGAAPLGRSTLPIIETVQGNVPQPRYLSDSGRLFFDTQNALSPRDTNGGSEHGRAVEDVYEWEPDGLGSCAESQGCVALISDGHGDVDSNFLAADAEGKNVFFVTRAQLVGQDKDGLLDVYDARMGGGFEQAPSSHGCSGETCQSVMAPPLEATPSSTTVAGEAATVAPVKCNVGQVKENGKCVKPVPKKAKKKRKPSKHRKKRAKSGRRVTVKRSRGVSR